MKVAYRVIHDSGVAAAEATMPTLAPQLPAPRADSRQVVDIRKPEDWQDSRNTASGECVNDQAAMRIAAFWACLRLLASTIGSLPLVVYEKDPEDTPRPARGSQIYKVLHDSPNADQTPTDYWEFAVISMLLRGNHYARKQKLGGRLIGLDPIRPDIVCPYRRSDGRLGYRWSEHGRTIEATEAEVFHVRGFGGGPLGGLSTIGYARESLGVAIAADRSAGSMFANGARPSGTLNFKEWIEPDKRKEARTDVEERFTGAMNAGRPFILEGGAEWKPISMNADDQQLLESRGWSVEEVCRWFGVPPFMIGHNEKTTSWGTGIEQMVLGFLKFTLNPYLRRIKQAIWKQLLTPEERAAGLFAEFNVEGLLQADSLGRARFYQIMTQIGAYAINDVRRKENLPPIEGGEVPRIQTQNAPISGAIAPPEEGE